MRCCCSPQAYEAFFSERIARRDARRYRKKGLDKTARRMVGFLTGQGVGGATVLEVGGGVGAIQLELLRAGAERTVDVELSSAYEASAAQLLREAGLEGRVERRPGDFVQDVEIDPADAVVMHRVVCCYPDYEGLVSAAADRARKYLVFSFPRGSPLVRIGFRAVNLCQRLLRREFRAYVHPVEAMLGVARARGLQPAVEYRGWLWCVAALERAPA